jgi:hypothetical protein
MTPETRYQNTYNQLFLHIYFRSPTNAGDLGQRPNPETLAWPPPKSAKKRHAKAREGG